MATRKTWKEKLNAGKQPQVKRLEAAFADIPANSNMLIATPLILDTYIRQIPKGTHVPVTTLRKDLALEYNADYTCPVTTGIFLRIVAEAAYEQFEQGKKITAVTPFWRVVAPGSPLAGKLSFGQDLLLEQRQKEGIDAG